jgi:hypothetical protein
LDSAVPKPPQLRHSGLPAELSSLVGRGPEITAALERLHASRVVTLTGPGGCGKTRLALRVAALAEAGFHDGARLVELAPLADPALVPASVAQALDVSERDATTPAAGLARVLADREMLVVLDNCEHVLDGVAGLLAALLERWQLAGPTDEGSRPRSAGEKVTFTAQERDYLAAHVPADARAGREPGASGCGRRRTRRSAAGRGLAEMPGRRPVFCRPGRLAQPACDRAAGRSPVRRRRTWPAERRQARSLGSETGRRWYIHSKLNSVGCPVAIRCLFEDIAGV